MDYHLLKMQKLLSLEWTWNISCASKNKEITKATLIILFISEIKMAYHMPVRLVISKFPYQLLLGGDQSNNISGGTQMSRCEVLC